MRTVFDIIDNLQDACLARDDAQPHDKRAAWELVKKLKKEAIDAIVVENLWEESN